MHFCMISQLNTGNTLFFIPLFKQQTLYLCMQEYFHMLPPQCGG